MYMNFCGLISCTVTIFFSTVIVNSFTVTKMNCVTYAIICLVTIPSNLLFGNLLSELYVFYRLYMSRVPLGAGQFPLRLRIPSVKP